MLLRNLVITFLKQVLNIKNCIFQEVGTKGTVDVLPSLNQKLLVLCSRHQKRTVSIIPSLNQNESIVILSKNLGKCPVRATGSYEQ